MIHLGEKKVLITGGSRGIGRATALLFARAGCDVAISFQKQKEAAEKVREKIEKIGSECLVFQADISQKKDVNLMIEELIKKWARIDILVNNAGIWTYGEMGSMSEEVWAETMKVNLDGVFFTCNVVVPFMKKEKRGWIINVSSTAAIRGESFHSHYAASKGAVVSLTKSLASELAPYNIRVNCIAPGWVETDMCSEVFKNPDFRREVQESIPLKRIPTPEDIAGPILFLASDLAKHITGEVLNVNGGSVLCA
ncbi:MAG: SDR family oxidoreductase [Candidatus Aminicenantes bacterium]|nr:SDR family oxidoreductase [Candidatus Aminicenantes bacterium]MBL7083099.1 SDR family oxidoreductase [Candidatus Aminicenantes bacterium]